MVVVAGRQRKLRREGSCCTALAGGRHLLAKSMLVPSTRAGRALAAILTVAAQTIWMPAEE